MTGPSGGQRRALLIGVASYPAEPELPNLRCPLNDVEGLGNLLDDPARGAFDTVQRLEDATSSEMKLALNVFVNETTPDDTALIYFSGHGMLDSSFDLHLCTSDSRRAVLEASSVPDAFLWNLIGKCRAERKVLILDCCYSASSGGTPRSAVKDQLTMAASGSGAYLLASTTADKVALELEGDRYGVFTKHLIGGLETGAADRAGDGVITMDGLHDYVTTMMAREVAQRPYRRVDSSGDIMIAKSGRDTRKDRAVAARRTLYGHVSEDLLDAKFAELAYEVAAKPLSALDARDHEIDAALDDLLSGAIGVGAFAGRLHQAIESCATAPAPQPRPEPAPEQQSKPEPDVEPAPGNRQTAWSAPGKDNERSPWNQIDAATAKPSLLPGNKDLLFKYGIPGACLALLPALAAATNGNGLLPGLVVSVLTVWNLKTNLPRLGLGGVIANSFLLFLGVLALISGLLA
ncbi:MAG: caspase family protein [Pseudomonadota bacterium]